MGGVPWVAAREDEWVATKWSAGAMGVVVL